MSLLSPHGVPGYYWRALIRMSVFAQERDMPFERLDNFHLPDTKHSNAWSTQANIVDSDGNGCLPVHEQSTLFRNFCARIISPFACP